MSGELHTLTGAYALDAVSPEEAAEFERHLTECASCTQEVRELREVAARMGESEAMRPPPHLKAAVMAAADKLPQLPPQIDSPAVETDRRFVRQSEGRRRMPRLLAAAAAVLVIGGGAVAVGQLNDEPDSQIAAPVAQVFEADDANSETMKTSNGGEVKVATSPSLGQMAVDTDELPELTGGQVYQIWSITGATTESAAVLDDPDAGAAMAMPSEGVAVAITIEPDGGSEQPTTEPIIRMVPSEV